MEPARRRARIWVAFLPGLLDVALPRLCAACGESLRRAGPRPPLCPACRESLAPIGEPRCSRCGRELLSEEGLCMECRAAAAGALDGARPLFDFRGPVREALSAYKFGGRRSLAPLFAALAAQEIGMRWPGWPIVPVPPRPGKLRARGWDQVEDIAAALEAGGASVARVLERVGSGEQKRLGRRERLANARGSYRLREGAVPPERAVLLDDVMTTGATAEACAAALKAGGSSRVFLLAIAAD